MDAGSIVRSQFVITRVDPDSRVDPRHGLVPSRGGGIAVERVHPLFTPGGDGPEGTFRMPRTSSDPRVSIGLPVYNGEEFLREALDSILGQTFTDFELIISDNASEDGTEEICREYARQDSRIRYDRSTSNIGGSRNHNRVFRLARGEYFAWAGHDDVRAADCLARCVEVLDARPDVVNCYSDVQLIDSSGKRLGERRAFIDLSGESRNIRFREAIRMDYRLDMSYGLIRSDVLRRTALEGQYPDSDRVLAAELALHGPFVHIPELLLSRREHTAQSVAKHPSRYERMQWINPRPAGILIFPYVRQFFEYVHAINRVPLPWRERAVCYRSMVDWLRTNRPLVEYDIKRASRLVARSTAKRLGLDTVLRRLVVAVRERRRRSETR